MASSWSPDRSERSSSGWTWRGRIRDTDRTLLARAALRYRDQETWAIQPLISAQEFDVIREIFYAGGAIKARHAYEAVVDTEIARLVTAEGSRR